MIYCKIRLLWDVLINNYVSEDNNAHFQFCKYYLLAVLTEMTITNLVLVFNVLKSE